MAKETESIGRQSLEHARRDSFSETWAKCSRIVLPTSLTKRWWAYVDKKKYNRPAVHERVRFEVFAKSSRNARCTPTFENTRCATMTGYCRNRNSREKVDDDTEKWRDSARKHEWQLSKIPGDEHWYLSCCVIDLFIGAKSVSNFHCFRRSTCKIFSWRFEVRGHVSLVSTKCIESKIFAIFFVARSMKPWIERIDRFKRLKFDLRCTSFFIDDENLAIVYKYKVHFSRERSFSRLNSRTLTSTVNV